MDEMYLNLIQLGRAGGGHRPRNIVLYFASLQATHVMRRVIMSDISTLVSQHIACVL